MDGLCLETLEGVAAAIRENRVDNLLDVDWEKVTEGFQSGRLMELVMMIDVSKVLRGRENLSLETLIKIQSALDIEILKLW